MINIEQTVDNLFKDINKVRKDPRSFGHGLARKENLYTGDIYKPKGKYIQTKEGVNALRDACFQLQKSQQLAPLTWSFALHVLADQEALYIGSSGLTRGDKPLSERVPKYALVSGRINQIIVLGGTESDQILHQLIVDDGLATRRRRKTILDPNYKYIGVATAKHKTYGYCTVIIFAEQIHQLLKPTQQLVQLQAEKGQKKPVDPNQNYYKMKKPPTFNQVKHFKRSRVVTPPPQPPVQPPTVIRSLNNSRAIIQTSPQKIHQSPPVYQQQQIIQQIIEPVQPFPQIVQNHIVIDQPPPVMMTSKRSSTGLNAIPPQMSYLPDPNAQIITQARNSTPGLVVTPPPHDSIHPYDIQPQDPIRMSQQDYRGTIITPPQHVQLINRLSQHRPPELVQMVDQSPGFFDKCTGNCLLF